MNRRKLLAIIMAWVLVLQVISGIGMLPANADDPAGSTEMATVTGDTYGTTEETDSATSVSETESILTKVTVKDSKGTVIDAVYNPDRLDRSHLGDAVTIEYEWALEDGHGYKDGDIFEFDIPKEFTIYNTINGQLINDDDFSVGEFTVDINGHVVMKFNSNVEQYSEIGGKLEIHIVFSTETIKGSVEVPIYFPIKGGVQVVKVNFEPKDGNLLKKAGVAVKDTNIDWTLDINTSLAKISKAEVTDQIPQGLTLDPGSIHVYRLQVNLDREPELGTEVTQDHYTLTTEPDGSAFRLAFTEPSIDSAYRIVYSTLVTGEEETSFTNAAELKDQNGIVAQESKTVTIQREKLLTKEAGTYNQATQSVSWTVKYNYGAKSIPQADASIRDRFDQSMDIVVGSLKVYKALTGEEVNSSLYKITPVSGVDGKNGFDLQFLTDINTAYNIKYETKIKGRVYQNTPVTNSVYSELSGKETSAAATHTFRSGIGVKSVASTNYSSKEITWRIVVNRDQWPMTNLVIEDAFSGGGLEYIPNSLNISASGGTVLPYKLEDSKPDQGFKLSFTGTFKDTYTITYKTKFHPGKSVYKNTALLNWTEKTSQYPGPVKVEASFTPNKYTINNGYKEGRYDPREKKLTWDVIANYNGFPITGAVLSDELKEGQKLVKDSVQVYHANVLANGNVVKGSKLVLDSSRIQYSGNLLTIDLGNISSPYWITFDTKLDKTLVADEIPNKAILTGEGGKSWSWDKKVTIPYGEVYIDKTGARKGDLIDWQIKINEGQSYVENARIIDTPSSNQILVKDSFKLYKGAVAANGAVTPGELLTKGTDYNITFHNDEANDQESFELTFTGPIETAYVLQYSSKIAVSADREQVTNQAVFKGDGVTTGVQETEETIEIRYSNGSGTGSGVRGALTVTKVDKDDPSLKLAGAKYELRNSAGKVVGEKTTNDLGQITFTKLLYGTYTLIETEAPAGYVLDAKAHSVVIDRSIQQTGGIKSVTLINEKKSHEPGNPGGPGEPETPEYRLEIVKLDFENSSLLLAGATFELRDQGQQQEPMTLTTDSSGTAVFTGLRPGVYTLKEIAAPAGYQIENAVRNVVIGQEGTPIDDIVTLTLTVTNRKVTVPPGNPGTPSDPGDNDDDDDDSGSSDPGSDQGTGNGSNPPGETPGGNAPDSSQGTETGTTPDPTQASEAETGEGNGVEVPNSGAAGGQGPSGQMSSSGDNAVTTVGKNHTLPQTGERSALPIQLTGLVIMLLGIWLKLRKKQIKE
ncbi:SpaA isopeptide-forming pilin-related protein [Paenibacillus sp. P96]|uniref:SpaA isopeptide-forming pilin-related protein n=1 Tax=Paenibacillus zeirhizosphaerae TaxID=2987519 RepID=A0ABT9FSD0_9BACL|nr:LPXTG cell wall anchor domain-containing protein [Paenibacillus sp. P96]MDP4097637.1 SpaA isopeptide-forming pilin-related protein [Paenibacillus sp. P96]